MSLTYRLPIHTDKRPPEPVSWGSSLWIVGIGPSCPAGQSCTSRAQGGRGFSAPPSCSSHSPWSFQRLSSLGFTLPHSPLAPCFFLQRGGLQSLSIPAESDSVGGQPLLPQARPWRRCPATAVANGCSHRIWDPRSVRCALTCCLRDACTIPNGQHSFLHQQERGVEPHSTCSPRRVGASG